MKGPRWVSDSSIEQSASGNPSVVLPSAWARCIPSRGTEGFGCFSKLGALFVGVLTMRAL